MIRKSFDIDVWNILGIPKEAFRNILLLDVNIDLNSLEMYIDKDQIVIIWFAWLRYLFEVVSHCNYIELVQGFEIWVDFFAVFDVSLHEAMCGAVELWGTHGQLHQ